ncbi:MAG: MMPL family transporter [Chloroflexi bacterium]|nr:MMPL family transporter [Chloroflexota bacterium]
MLEALRFRRSGKTRHEARETESTLDTSTLSFTGRTASWSARHRWWVVAASVMVLVLAMFVISTVETKTLDYNGEGEASVGAQLIDDRFEFNPPPTEQLVFSNPSLDSSDPAYRSTVEKLVQQLRALPEVASVTSFYDTNAPGMVSEGGHVVLARVELDSKGEAEDKIEPILEKVRAAAADADGFEIVMAGNTSIEKQLNEIIEEDFARIMMITLVLGLVIMILAFRAVVAAVIPLILAIGSIFSAIGVATLVSQIIAMDEIYTEVVLLMGMAVGIDYSLFIISRYRSERKAGRPKLDAIAVASDTTGRAVFYAGVTVVLSLAGLFLTFTAIFTSLAIGAIIVVLIALVGSLTLLPALLSILGDNINRLRVPFIGRERNENNGGIWSAISDRVLARPGIFATVAAGALILLAVPVVSLNMGFNSGANSLHDDVKGKRALQLLEEHFTSSLAAPAIVVVDAPEVTSPQVQASVANLIDIIEQDSDFFPPFDVKVNRAGDLLFVTVPTVGSIDDQESEDALRHLRDDIVSAAFADSGAQVYVTGQTAGSVDFKDHMGNVAPYVFGFVLGLSFLLLLVMFRSIVIPVKAIVLNLLSVGAAYGVLVAVFQWGWGVGLLGMEKADVISAWLPLFLFSILFGLSMDYHMLLLSRIKEAYDQGHSNEESVSMGIRVTAGQITSAAAVMVGVFGAFALGREMGLKQFGVGLGVAVFLDATVIRSVLLPASMKLLGDRNWYLPRWLQWLPKVGVGEATEPAAATAFAD